MGFEHPVCTEDGTVFDISNIFLYIKKYHKHPILGEKLDIFDIIKLNFYNDTIGKFYCPISHKEFTNKSHIIANRLTGNVYSFEAINELNLKTKNMRDLITNEIYKRSDLITIQNTSKEIKAESCIENEKNSNICKIIDINYVDKAQSL